MISLEGKETVNQVCELGAAITAALCISGCSPAARYSYFDGITEIQAQPWRQKSKFSVPLL
jgi:hypothetical protein